MVRIPVQPFERVKRHKKKTRVSRYPGNDSSQLSTADIVMIIVAENQIVNVFNIQF